MRHQLQIGIAGLATALALVTAPISAAAAPAHPVTPPTAPHLAPVDSTGSSDLASLLGFAGTGSGAVSSQTPTGSGTILLGQLLNALLAPFGLATGSGLCGSPGCVTHLTP